MTTASTSLPRLHGWPTGRKLSLILGMLILVATLTGFVAVWSVRSVTSTRDDMASIYTENAVLVARLGSTLERGAASAHEFLLTGEPSALERYRATTASFDTELAQLQERTANDVGRAMLDEIARVSSNYDAAMARALSARQNDGDTAKLRDTFEAEVLPAKAETDRLLYAFAARKLQQLEDAEQASSMVSVRAMGLTGVVAGAAVLSALALGLLLRRALGDLTKTQARVEQSNHDLEAFAGRIAHDVRNALGPIAVAPALLRANDLGTERREAICQRLEHAVERAVGLVDGLLAFSRAGQPPEPNASTSIRSVVAAVLEELESKIEQGDITVEVELEDCEVCCAPGLLHMVVANVLGNAVKFVRGQPVRRVRVQGEKARRGYILRVDDTGPGIPDGARERIFEPFFRVPGTKVAGTGIGLATVHRIVEAYGGWVRVESRVGEGSSFRICLPRREDEDTVKSR